MDQLDPVSPATIAGLGGSADLTRCRVVPALHSLACARLLPPASRMLGGDGSPFARADQIEMAWGLAEAGRGRHTGCGSHPEPPGL